MKTYVMVLVAVMAVSAVAWATKTAACKEPGLVAHYTFDEGEGNIVHNRSGNGKYGKVIGAVKWVKIDSVSALEFNGKDTYIDCGSSDGLNITRAGTLEVWFNMKSAQGGLVNFSTGGSWGDERLVIAFDTWRGGKRFIWCVADGKTYQSRLIEMSAEGLWTHVALNYDGFLVQVFKDGLLRYAVTQNVTPEVKGVPLWIGRCLGLGKEYFHGLIAEVRIYNRALSEKEIFEHYNAKAKVFGRSLAIRKEPNRREEWTTPERAKQKGVKWLNNFVAELLNLKRLPNRTYIERTFTNPREGWVFFRSTAKVKGSGKVQIFVDSEGKPLIVHTKENAKNQEAMRFLPAGRHKVRVQQEGQVSKGNASLKSLVVRAVPELLYHRFAHQPSIPQYGPYDWQFLERHILNNLNCMIGAGESEHGPYIQQWKRKGKNWLVPSYVPGMSWRAGENFSAEEVYEYWTKLPGLQDPLVDGLILDEFGDGDLPMYHAWTEAVRRIRSNQQFKDKKLYGN